ncbi:MAG: hypothetical protein ABW166_19375 [Sedimenticola sp.]
MINFFTPKYMEKYIKEDSKNKKRIDWLTIKIYQLRAQMKIGRFDRRVAPDFADTFDFVDIQICQNTLDRLLDERKALYNKKGVFK